MTTRLLLLAIDYDPATSEHPAEWNWGDPRTLDPDPKLWAAAVVDPTRLVILDPDDGTETPVGFLSLYEHATHTRCAWPGCNVLVPIRRLVHPHPHGRGATFGTVLCSDHASEAGDLKDEGRP